jgi:hypothetical protein
MIMRIAVYFTIRPKKAASDEGASLSIIAPSSVFIFHRCRQLSCSTFDHIA